jgi:hypothetical protein
MQKLKEYLNLLKMNLINIFRILFCIFFAGETHQVVDFIVTYLLHYSVVLLYGNHGGRDAIEPLGEKE